MEKLNYAGVLNVILLFSIIAIPLTGYAAWSNDPTVNTPISTADGNDWHPRMLTDSHGGAIITWENYGTIYVQGVDANGDVLWQTNGVSVSSSGDCRLPQLVSDGAGGAIITWLNYSNFDTGIFAQRIDSNGTLVWTDAVTVSDASLPLKIIGSPSIVSDNSGGAIIAWMDYRGGYQGIYAQRIDSSGAAQWTANGIGISNLTACSDLPVVISDGAHGAIITWSYSSPYCSGSSSYADIYAQRVDGAGIIKWGDSGAAVCTASNNQYLSDAKSDGNGGVIVTWDDRRNGTPSVYAQKMDFNGNAKWTANGVAVSTSNSTAPFLTSDGSGGAYFTWWNGQNIYAQRLDANGSTQWPGNGVLITNLTFNNSGGLSIMGDGSGNAIIAYLDGHNANSQGFLYTQKVDRSGNVKWQAGGVAVSTPAQYSVFDIRLVTDGAGGAIFSWYDQRNYSATGDDIYAQKIWYDGVLAVTCPGSPVRVGSTPYDTIHDAYNAAYDGDILQMQTYAFFEDVLFDKSISIRLKGGYDCGFSSNARGTMLYGSMTISGGTVTVENFIIQ
jgi:hypothetical protein